ncbi:hypothetical protein [Halomonas sp. HG01]|uniref:hypothetical protein n=1 Tax=Halomonas sp. HG01 TaxID=1609967 RepID=UPI00128E3AC4|nr:hypothetical protein [Halomonas sp. HG01]
MKKNKANYSVGGLFLIFVFLPILAYVYKFGIGFWDNHEDWSYMGDYFGGVLGPIITSLSLFFLAFQIRFQSQQRAEENSRHICFEGEKNIEKALEVVKPLLDEARISSNLKLTAEKIKELKEQEKNDEARKEANRFFSDQVNVLSNWARIDVSLRDMRDHDENKCRMAKWGVYATLKPNDVKRMELIRKAVVPGESVIVPEEDGLDVGTD